jgi:1,4-dihydroxy-2-naphthoyl-CoA hydrolase
MPYPPLGRFDAVDEALTQGVRDAMPFAGTLGIDMLSASPDEVRGRVAWEERLTTAAGLLHGGVLMGLADAIGAYLAFLNLPEGSSATATIESKTNFFAAVRSGTVEGRARPLHRGSRTIVVETDLYDEGGKHVARVTQTQAVL